MKRRDNAQTGTLQVHRSDLTEKKLPVFVFTDSAVLQCGQRLMQKVKHKVVREAGFPCIPTIFRKWGGGLGALIRWGFLFYIMAWGVGAYLDKVTY